MMSDTKRSMITIDGNEAAARVAHKLSEVIAIYPITPSSPMGEWADEWTANGKTNLWGTVPAVVEMQSEGGAAGAVHGALQSGALSTTFTASQGLLLMIPNMFKIAGELTPTVFHVSARSLAAQALSIFGDHSDVYATRSTGFALLCSNSVQEVMDFALISYAATLESRIPFMHFFDGFRTSHEVQKIEALNDDDLRAMIDQNLIFAHRQRALSPDHPVMRGTAQNPDVYFQGRETVNPFYVKTPGIVQKAMDKFAQVVGRQYHLFDYVGAPDADRVIIVMGSGAEITEEAMHCCVGADEKIGLLKVHLYRPFSVEHFLKALPATVKKIAVLDRTKEPGSAGEPLYQDVLTALAEGWTGPMPLVVGGRYGLSSKEFTPAMVKGIYNELAKVHPKNHFTIGINDDVSHSSLDYDATFSAEGGDTVRAVFYGLGSDGTVGANKNSIKIIGEDTPNFAQGFFYYDSKKSGTMTTSHLRFGPQPIQSSYLISRASFVACHQFSFTEYFNPLKVAEPHATFLLNTPFCADDVWDHLPRIMQQEIIDKQIKFYVIDGNNVAEAVGMGDRINTIMQTCFFAISGVLPRDEAIEAIKHSIKKTYGRKGDAVVQKNYHAVDQTLAHLQEVTVPDKVSSPFDLRPPVPAEAPEFVQKVTARIIAGDGDSLPVSLMPVDGTFPTGTSQYEKRNLALKTPVWDPSICIQCGKCTLVCPHAVIRGKVYETKQLEGAPATFKSMDAKWKEFAAPNYKYTVQISVEDCTGCALCVQNCPAKSKTDPNHKAINMTQQAPLREAERENWKFFLDLPEIDRRKVNTKLVKDVQLLRPLFEFSGACAGCGETPYVKLLSQLFGDRAIIANATGCSSIYGGNLPTTPWTKNAEGRGPAWSNSLFEDNAEFGMGFRLTIDKQTEYAQELVKRLAGEIGGDLADGLLKAELSNETSIADQRERVKALKAKLQTLTTPEAKDLLSLADMLVRKSVWILGGDGWAYDIGYGGLDHVLASGRNVNVLVLDTEVYSNTGGQMSKSTPRAATARFAAGGKTMPKKDLGMLAVTYGNIYVARVALGADDSQLVKAFLEAEAYDGPSLIIAYAHCIQQGYELNDLRAGLEHQKLAVQSGHWPLFRYNPALEAQGKNPFQLDSKAPSIPLEKYIYTENRYAVLTKINEEAAERLLKLGQEDVNKRWAMYSRLAGNPETK
jgi:pyruvate-ferredoxin/flavodoxin oxidoreductase